MIKKNIFLLAIIFSLCSYGQNSFDYKRDYYTILKKTQIPDDSLNFDALKNRFIKNDTTLTDYEVLVLLIGFTSKSEYKPYTDLKIETDIYDLNGKRKYKKALNLADRFLIEHPLSQRALIEKSYALHKLGFDEEAKKYSDQFFKIMKAMAYSGNGDLNRPIFALSPNDGQNFIIKFLHLGIGKMASGNDLAGSFSDILEAIKDGKPQKLYFNIQHAIKKM